MLQGTIPEMVHAGSQCQQRNSGNDGDFHFVGFINEKMDDPAKISAGWEEKIDYQVNWTKSNPKRTAVI
jgi:hypothetical protein